MAHNNGMFQNDNIIWSHNRGVKQGMRRHGGEELEQRTVGNQSSYLLHMSLGVAWGKNVVGCGGGQMWKGGAHWQQTIAEARAIVLVPHSDFSRMSVVVRICRRDAIVSGATGVARSVLDDEVGIIVGGRARLACFDGNQYDGAELVIFLLSLYYLFIIFP